jgi:hypothetical protein
MLHTSVYKYVLYMCWILICRRTERQIDTRQLTDRRKVFIPHCKKSRRKSQPVSRCRRFINLCVDLQVKNPPSRQINLRHWHIFSYSASLYTEVPV